MNDLPNDLPEDLRAKLEAHLVKHPDTRPLIDRLMVKRGAAPEAEAVKIEAMLRQLITPNRWPWFLLGAIGLLVLGILGNELWSHSERQKALERSSPATALVKRMVPGDCWNVGKTQTCLTLELEVHREGEAPYTSSLTQAMNMEWMPRVQPGSWLTVAVDPEDPKAVLFDERSMAIAPPTPP